MRQRAFGAIGDEADRRHRDHRQHQRREQDADVAGRHVAQQLPPRQAAASSCGAPSPTRRSRRPPHPGAGGGRSVRPGARRGSPAPAWCRARAFSSNSSSMMRWPVCGVEVAGGLVGEQQRRARSRRRAPAPRAAARRRRAGADSGRGARPGRRAQDRARRRLRVASPRSSSGSITFSSAVSAGSNWKLWNTKPTFSPRRRARPSSSSADSVVAVEADACRSLGRSRPASSDSKVLLPEPEAPTIATASPWLDARNRPLRGWSALPDGSDTRLPSRRRPAAPPSRLRLRGVGAQFG